MKTRLLLPTLVVFLLGLVLVWLFRPSEPFSGTQLPGIGPEQRSATHAEPHPVQNTPPEDVPDGTPNGATPNAGARSAGSNFPQVEHSVFYEDWKRPIKFFGKVEGENGNPVPEANVRFSWTDTSPEGRSESQCLTDTNGLFSLQGATGRMLTVTVGKVGYYASKKGRTHFDYSPNFAVDLHEPDPNTPVVFHLRKKGAGTVLVTSQYGFSPELEVSVPRAGNPVSVDLMQRKVGTGGQLTISQTKPEYLEAKDATAWSFRMAIPSGGFVEQHDEFPFEAPESGYQPVVEFQFDKGETNWATSLKKSYYVRFGQPPCYGWLTVETAMGWGGARLRYAINPDGSRYLESKAAQPAKRELPPGVIEVIPGQPQ